MSRATQYIEIEVLNPEAAARTRGLHIATGRRRVASARPPETRKVLGGTVRISPGTAEGGDKLPWLEEDIAVEYRATSTRYPKGADAPTDEVESRRLLDAVVNVKDDLLSAPAVGTPMYARHIDALAEIFFGFGVSLAKAVAAIGAEHKERVEAVYRDGSTATPWAALAEAREAEEARLAAVEQAKKADEEELVAQPGVHRGFDAVILSTPEARAAAPAGWQSFLGHDVVGVRNAGIRPTVDRQVALDIWLVPPDSARIPAMARRDVRAIPTNYAWASGGFSTADLYAEINLARPCDARSVREDEYRDLRDPATEYAIERALEQCEPLWRHAFDESTSRARIEMINFFRGRCVHPVLVVRELEKRAKERWPAKRGATLHGWDGASLTHRVQQVYAGVGAHVTPGALTEEDPPQAWIDRYFRGNAIVDPLRDVVAAFVDGKPAVKSQDVEKHLEEEGFEITSTLRQRLHGLLVSLGLVKGRKSEGGKSPRVWKAGSR